MNRLPGYDARTSTIDRVLREHAQRWGDKTFLTWLPTGATMSYRQLDDLTLRVGAGLAVAGVAAGSHVGVLMNNCPEQLLAILGPARAGYVSVPLNAAAKGQLLAYFLDHADCTALVVEEALLPRFLEASAQLPRVRHVFVVRPDRGEPPLPQDPVAAPPGVVLREFTALLQAPATPPEAPPAFSALAMLMFTSGTTGPSKAIMYTHAHFIYWGSDVAYHHEYTPEDIAYVFLPLFHGNALLGSTMGSLMAGAAIALAPRFSVSRFWEHVRSSGATVFNGVGAVTNFLWKQPPSPADRDHRVRRCHLAPVPGFAREFEQRFGMAIMSAFGLTDYCLGAAYNTKSRRDKLGSCGLPRAGMDIRIVDEDDFDVPPGTPGEIVMRNNNPWGASLGYYKQAEATAASRRNLWFHTGDRGRMDEDGYVWYTDRIKDAIRRRGENISAFEVEEVIRTHPAVADVAVYPVRAETSEDEVAATITLRPDAAASFSYESLLEHCSRNLAYFMVPRYVQVAADMPATLSQKIEKYKLRRAAEADLSALWDRERAGISVAR
ncbi:MULTISPECIES: AMP-binding protein [Ramlibacter]|uniref:AMP-binding protein n=1 Tax=Ramlibacter pinisoli TaxID=2682844 RepID=A0A6N8IRR3_9BURK|nr:MULTISPECIES: AMP-binding protein [Ramlibacter]MBA2963840.1 AMP-binding protein [Ramlibacter sp. CGMCC 1.13660]MVQ28806.1 AMP-binding protein [Ramlibacter pinisoli]